MTFTSFSTFCALGLLATISSASAQAITQDSPFGAPAVTVNDRALREKLELAGISVVGEKTFICLFDTEKSQNRWLAVGEKSGAIEVVSCDVKADRAVIKVSGQLKTLGLRRATVSAEIAVVPSVAAPAASGSETATTPPPASDAAAAPQTEQQVQEREARMLVSDLLEIGMQQRKAYEEKKATEDTAKKAAPPAQK